MAKRKKKPQGVLGTAVSMGAGSLSITPLEAARRALTKPLARAAFKGERIPLSEAKRLSDVMKFEGPIVPTAGGKFQSRRGIAILPALSKAPIETALPAAAHEFGHAKGGILQALGRGFRHALFGRPRIPLTKAKMPLVSPLHLPLLLAAASPKEKDGKGVVEWLKRHPALSASLLAAPGIAGEAHASLRGLAGIRKMVGTKAALKAAGPLSAALGHHALSYVPAIVALWGVSKIRDILQKRHEKKAGMIGKAVSRPLISVPKPGRIVREHDEMVPISDRHRPDQKQTPGRRGETN